MIGDEDKGQTRTELWLSKIARRQKTTLPTGDFVFRIVISSPGETFTLPLGSSLAYCQDFTVDWGDSSSSTITSSTDTDKTHTYASAGTYDIEMSGTCQYFGFGTDADKITSLLSLSADMGFMIFKFELCTNLAYIDSSISNISSIETFELAFYGCTSLTTIPSGLFDNCVDVVSFKECFLTSGLTTIPSGLFDKNTLVTTFYRCFQSCTNLTAIPAGLFDYNVLTTTFWLCFAVTGITSIPSGLFDNCVKVTSLGFCFTLCVNITALPANLILYNVLTEKYDSMFNACSGMTAGDGTDFVDTAKANATSQGITLTHSDCFKNCISLPDYALIPADWK